MKFLEKLTKKPKTFQRTIGLDLHQFKKMVKNTTQYWNQAELERKNNNARKRKIGGGRTYKLECFEHMLASVLMYYKTYITQELLGIIIGGIDQSNVSRLIKKMADIIERAADPELATYLSDAKKQYELNGNNKIGDFQSFLKKYPDLEEVSTDATEQKCHRPQNYEEQKNYYSGKKNQHSLKTQISVSSSGRIIDISETYPGKNHDKTILDIENTVRKFPEKTPQRFDAGYQGAAKDNSEHYVLTPFKKPRKQELSDVLKEMNQIHSRRRVVVENALARLKKFRIIGGVYRGLKKTYNQIFRNIAAILNFRLLNSQPRM